MKVVARVLVAVAIAATGAMGGYSYAAAQEAPTPAIAVAAPAAVGGQVQLVNLNSASAAELEALPGIGKATAERIIAARPIASVDAVGALPGVNDSNFSKFQNLVTV